MALPRNGLLLGFGNASVSWGACVDWHASSFLGCCMMLARFRTFGFLIWRGSLFCYGLLMSYGSLALYGVLISYGAWA
jgi:hypothetical protein